MFTKKNFYQAALISACLIFAISYILGCGSSSGGTTSNPMGIGQSTVLSGRILVSEDVVLPVNAGQRLSILAAESSGKKAVKDCEVWLENYPEVLDITDESGYYSLEKVPQGKHRVVAKYQTSAGGPAFKMRGEHVEVEEKKGLHNAEDIELKPAKNSVSGVLRDADGKPLPFGTKCSLWGETFTVGVDGRFDSPALPEGFEKEEIKVSATANTEAVTISAPFITDQAAPMQIEIFMPEKGGNGNNAPVVFLTSRKGGVPSSKVGMGEQLTLIAEGYDPDPADANNLSIEWEAAKGTLATSSAAPFQAVWTAPDQPGMAAIGIKIFDSQGAWSSAKLMILVGLDQVPPSTPIDIIPPALLSMAPASGSANVPAVASITLNFNEDLASASVNTDNFLVSSGTSPITISLSISSDTRSVVITPADSWPSGATITIRVDELKDMSLNALTELICSFSTLPAPAIDAVAPTVVITDDHPAEILRDGTTVFITATFTEADQIDETAPPAISIGSIVTNAAMTKVSNLVWTYSWFVPAGTIGAQAVSITARDRAGNQNTPATGKSSYNTDYPMGDVNGDGKADGKDLEAMRQYVVKLISTLNRLDLADLNSDGAINILDIIKLRRLQPGIPVFSDPVIPANLGGTGNAANNINTALKNAFTSFKVNLSGNLVLDRPAPLGKLFIELSDSAIPPHIYTTSGEPIALNAPAADVGAFEAGAIDSFVEGSITIKAWISDSVYESEIASITLVQGYGPDRIPPTNQDTVLAGSVTIKGGLALTIVSSGDAANSVWLAPAGTTSFVESATITKAGGTATSINAPATEGTYKLFVIDAAGNISAASTASLTVDNTAPTNQNIVLAASASVKDSVAVTIVSSGDASNSVWLAPAGTTSFVESLTMTKAGGTATSINAPATEGIYKLFIIDAAGNISAASTADVNVDNTPPTVLDVYCVAPDGTYASGSIIDFVVNFDENITNSGTPQLLLETGGIDQAASMISITGTTMFFRLTIQAGGYSTDLDYVNSSALILNGGSIVDFSGNNAVLTLPSPGAAGSIGANNNVVIDAILPVVSAPISAGQLLRSGEMSSSTVLSDKAGKIYFVKRGEAADTQAAIDAAISANKAFLAKDGAVANTPYLVTVAAGVIDGLYDLVAVDSVGNVSAIEAGWLTVAIDYLSPNIGNLKYVPTGTFQRDATPTNVSTVSGFKISQHEVTRTQFSTMIGSDPTNPTYSSGVTDPVQKTNWYHAIAFCNKLSIAEGLTPVYTISGIDFSTLTYAAIPSTNDATWDAATCNWSANGYRLPTEMEWMWAAMGAALDSQPSAMSGGVNVTGYAKLFAGYNGSNSIDAYVWYFTNSSDQTHPVGTKLANELDLYDMNGNVWEWCWDFHDSYPVGSTIDYRGGGSSPNRVVRGGGWGRPASDATVGYRDYYNPGIQLDSFGFRVVRP